MAIFQISGAGWNKVDCTVVPFPIRNQTVPSRRSLVRKCRKCGRIRKRTQYTREAIRGVGVTDEPQI